jgi:hypothetical protein
MVVAEDTGTTVVTIINMKDPAITGTTAESPGVHLLAFGSEPYSRALLASFRTVVSWVE